MKNSFAAETAFSLQKAEKVATKNCSGLCLPVFGFLSRNICQGKY
jgi:hypothetical protein